MSAPAAEPRSMRWWPVGGMGLAIVLLVVSGTLLVNLPDGPPDDSAAAAMEQARQRWEDTGPDSYVLAYQRFSEWGQGETTRVRVVDGTVVEVLEGDEPVDEALSVEAVFARLETSIDPDQPADGWPATFADGWPAGDHPDPGLLEVTATYDEATGAPLHHRIDDLSLFDDATGASIVAIELDDGTVLPLGTSDRS